MLYFRYEKEDNYVLNNIQLLSNDQCVFSVIGGDGHRGRRRQFETVVAVVVGL